MKNSEESKILEMKTWNENLLLFMKKQRKHAVGYRIFQTFNIVLVPIII